MNIHFVLLLTAHCAANDLPTNLKIRCRVMRNKKNGSTLLPRTIHKNAKEDA